MVSGVQRLFGTFPDGKAGAGLLLLRISLALTLFEHARKLGLASVSLLTMLAYSTAALLIFIGSLTPAVASVCSIVSAFTFATSHPHICVIPVMQLLTFGALALLGAGAYSLDAHLYGRRRLIASTSRSNP